MDTNYFPWTAGDYLEFEGISTVPQSRFSIYGITFVYIVLASEESINVRGNRFRVTIVLYKPSSGSYHETRYIGNDSPLPNDVARHSFSIYQNMKAQMRRNLGLIFRFDNSHSHRTLMQTRNQVILLLYIHSTNWYLVLICSVCECRYLLSSREICALWNGLIPFLLRPHFVPEWLIHIVG
jgi:hypothetical protein